MHYKKIYIFSFALSVLLHVALFIQFTNATPNSNRQAQAPVYDKRISVHLINPVKQKQVNHQELKNKKAKKIKQKIIKKKYSVIKKVQQQAIAPKLDKEVKRHEINNVVAVQQQYLSRLLMHIEGHKFYPYVARARGIEGSILVSFQLSADGKITELNTSGDYSRLRRAAKRAVNNALPLPACPADIACPMQVSYTMQFKLR